MVLTRTHSFVVPSDTLQNKLLSKAVVKFDANQVEVTAQWDTDATCSCISHDVSRKLSLNKRGQFTIQTPSGSKEVEVFLVDIILPDNVAVLNVLVANSDIGDQSIDLLIGMNVVKYGDLAVSNYEGKTWFSFRVPSQGYANYRV